MTLNYNLKIKNQVKFILNECKHYKCGKIHFPPNKLKRGEKMVTRLEKFKQEMAPAKEIYTKEITEFAKNYDFLGKMTLEEMPDIDTQDYIFCFEKLNGTREDILDKTLKELYDHMDDFSKEKGIDRFSRNVIISYKW